MGHTACPGASTHAVGVGVVQICLVAVVLLVSEVRAFGLVAVVGGYGLAQPRIFSNVEAVEYVDLQSCFTWLRSSGARVVWYVWRW